MFYVLTAINIQFALFVRSLSDEENDTGAKVKSEIARQVWALRWKRRYDDANRLEKCINELEGKSYNDE